LHDSQTYTSSDRDSRPVRKPTCGRFDAYPTESRITQMTNRKEPRSISTRSTTQSITHSLVELTTKMNSITQTSLALKRLSGRTPILVTTCPRRSPQLRAARRALISIVPLGSILLLRFFRLRGLDGHAHAALFLTFPRNLVCRIRRQLGGNCFVGVTTAAAGEGKHSHQAQTKQRPFGMQQSQNAHLKSLLGVSTYVGATGKATQAKRTRSVRKPRQGYSTGSEDSNKRRKENSNRLPEARRVADRRPWKMLTTSANYAPQSDDFNPFLGWSAPILRHKRLLRCLERG
jgi:hypothetical protein